MTKQRHPRIPQRSASGRSGWCWSTRTSTPRSMRRSVDCGQDRLLGRDAAPLGAAGRARPGRAGRADERGAGADQGARAGGARAAASQRDPAQGQRLFCPGGARPPVQAMIAFIDEHRESTGSSRSAVFCRSPRRPTTRMPPAGPIRTQTGPRARGTPTSARRSGGSSRRTSGSMASARSGASCSARGSRSARCTVARLMRQMGLQGVVRGKSDQDDRQRCGSPLPARPGQPAVQGAAAERLVGERFHLCRDLVGLRLCRLRDRRLRPPDRRLAGVALGPGRASCSMPWSRLCTTGSPPASSGLVHHSDSGVQYVSIKYTERLAEAGIEPSVGSVGDSYDNALAETIIGLFKAEVIHRRGPWRSFEAVEFATLEWVDWFNNRRLLEPIGNGPPPRRKPPTMLSLRSCRWPRRSKRRSLRKTRRGSRHAAGRRALTCPFRCG